MTAVSWHPLAFLPKFSVDRDDISVRELVGFHLLDFRRSFELCVTIRAEAAQFL